MTDKILDEYTAGEFIDWLTNEFADEYIKQMIDESEDETVINNMFDVELLKKNFIYHIRRYVVVERGHKLYIHDERHCRDIMMFRYTDIDKEEIQNHVNSLCDDLNQGKIIFTGRARFCD